jgi:hypothetical protein
MEGIYEEMRNPEANFMLSAKRTKISQMSSDEIGGKY